MRAYMFPGQGSQYPGMGDHLWDKFSEEVKKASHIVGYDIKDLCQYNPDNKLSLTQFTQPCLYLMNCLHYLDIKGKNNESPKYFCGHSLGEYTALFAANVFDLYTGLRIVKKRGEFMAEIKNGALVAILAEDIKDVMDILHDYDFPHIEAANFNTKSQLIIGGVEDDLSQAILILEQHHFRCVPLNVSGAFHTRYMESARIKFMKFLVNVAFNTPSCPVLCASTVTFFDPLYAIETLGFQITRPVYWLQTVQKLRALGVDILTEIGPKDVLTKMVNSIMVNESLK